MTHLDGVEFLFRSIPLVSELDNGSRTSTDSGLFADSVFLEQASGAGIVTLFASLGTTLLASLGRTGSRSFPSELRSRSEEIAQLEFGATVIALFDARGSDRRPTGGTTLGTRPRGRRVGQMTVLVGRSLCVRIVVILPAVLPLDAWMSARRFRARLRTVIAIAVSRTDRAGTAGRRISGTGSAKAVRLSVGQVDPHAVPVMTLGMLETFPRGTLLLVFPHMQHLVQERFLLSPVSQHDRFR